MKNGKSKEERDETERLERLHDIPKDCPHTAFWAGDPSRRGLSPGRPVVLLDHHAMTPAQERAFESAVTLLVKLLDTKPKAKAGRGYPFGGGIPTTMADGDTLESLIRTFHLDRKAIEEEAYERRKRRKKR